MERHTQMPISKHTAAQNTSCSMKSCVGGVCTFPSPSLPPSLKTSLCVTPNSFGASWTKSFDWLDSRTSDEESGVGQEEESTMGLRAEGFLSAEIPGPARFAGPGERRIQEGVVLPLFQAGLSQQKTD